MLAGTAHKGAHDGPKTFRVRAKTRELLEENTGITCFPGHTPRFLRAPKAQATRGKVHRQTSPPGRTSGGSEKTVLRGNRGPHITKRDPLRLTNGKAKWERDPNPQRHTRWPVSTRRRAPRKEAKRRREPKEGRRSAAPQAGTVTDHPAHPPLARHEGSAQRTGHSETKPTKQRQTQDGVCVGLGCFKAGVGP